MKVLRKLAEDLHALLDTPSIGIMVKCSDLASFDLLQNLVSASIRAVGQAKDLRPDDLRTWNTFVIGVERSASTSPLAGRGHIGAIWRAGANEICRQLSPDVSHAMEDAVQAFLDEGPHG